MAYKKRTPKHDWHSFLTSEENALIKKAERKRERSRKSLAEAAAVIAPIQNRAIQRAKYAAKEATSGD